MLVQGFKTAAVAAGIKAGGVLDLALICSDRPATAAAVFTQNTFIAAPLVVSKKNLKESGHRVRAILVNSGNANAATGEAGIQAARSCVDALAAQIGCQTLQVLVSSTGVIGRPLPVQTIKASIPKLVSALLPTNIEMLARGIMTTDTVPKIATAEFGGARIAGVAKGAGMIHPDMATMLSFIMTDADVPYDELDAAGQSLIKAAMRQLHLSARAYHRILKLARTIADLAGSERIEAAHLAEAVQYRPRQML